jgi:hypothetical protein
MINKKKCIVRIDQDFHILYRVVHDIVMSWFAGTPGSLRPCAAEIAVLISLLKFLLISLLKMLSTYVAVYAKCEALNPRINGFRSGPFGHNQLEYFRYRLPDPYSNNFQAF